MSDLIIVFRMEELSIDTRISLLRKIGEMINYEYASNISEPIVNELVGILESRKIN